MHLKIEIPPRFEVMYDHLSSQLSAALQFSGLSRVGISRSRRDKIIDHLASIASAQELRRYAPQQISRRCGVPDKVIQKFENVPDSTIWVPDDKEKARCWQMSSRVYEGLRWIQRCQY